MNRFTSSCRPLFRTGLTAISLALGLTLSTCPAQTMAELAARMEAMQKRIEELETRLAQAEAKAAPAAPVTTASTASSAPTGKQMVVSDDIPYADEAGIDAPAETWADRTSLGGYGEMHLNLGDKEQIDFHRWVLFLNHTFNDRVRLVTELELEHSLAGDDKPGEVELEQAYLEFDLGNDYWLKTGLFLLPVGLLNETHEPNTFFGTERNRIETEIIPTTWWEGGVMLTKNFESGLSLDLAGHSALDVPSDTFRIRSGRTKAAEAPASEGAATLRATYRGIPGIELGASGQWQSDITQLDGENNSATLAEAHARLQLGGFGLRALGAYWDISGATPASLGVAEQWGYFIEPSYTFSLPFGGDFGVFGRWGQLDAARGKSDLIDVGVNYWPLSNVVFKADWSRVSGDRAEDTINLGVGYSF